MGIVQDALLGSRLFTERDNFLDKAEVMNLLMWLPAWDGNMPQPAIIKPEALWTGKQIFSLLLPDVNLNRASGWHADVATETPFCADTKVVIRKGVLLAGILCKKTLGTSSGSLVHVIGMQHGVHRAAEFLSHTQYIINHWLEARGFSVGIGDLVTSSQTKANIAGMLQTAKVEVDQLLKQFRKGDMGNVPGQTLESTFEGKVNQILNAARDNAGKMVTLPPMNNIRLMADAGSKGSSINISQMTACVGQQNVEGRRIGAGLKGRSLPHYHRYDVGPEAGGFVADSYLEGLDAASLFFHAMGGREGLVDTAVKTSNTGYIQRRLIKAMEDLKVEYDCTVRTAGGQIVQFLYGEDGMSGEAVEQQSMGHVSYSERKFEEMYVHSPQNEDVQQEIRQLLDDVKVARSLLQEKGDTRALLPVNLSRLIELAQDQAGPTALDASQIVIDVRALEQQLGQEVIRGEGLQEARRNATCLFMCLARALLASKRVMWEYRLSREGWDWLLDSIRQQFQQALVSPGEMIGTLAAQSIGEPTTQMTLNTFHFAGVSTKNVTLGVPRLSELINASKVLKTPSLEIHLVSTLATDKVAAKQMQSTLEVCSLQRLVRAVEIHYDPDPLNTVVTEDSELLANYLLMPDEDLEVLQQASPWVLRMLLDREMLVDRDLSMAEVTDIVNSSLQNNAICISSDDNSPQLVLRVRLMAEEGKDGRDLLTTVTNNLLQLALKGVPGVHRVLMRSNSPGTEEWVLETEGSNLLEVMSIPGVDYTTTSSNHVLEVLQCLGVEAARHTLLRELRRVIEFDGSYVNYRHLSVLCDCMTRCGLIMPITRHGINRAGAFPLAQCAFEETSEILFRAATYAEADKLAGVTESIFMGQLANAGTGGFGLMLDEDMLLGAIEQQPTTPEMLPPSPPAVFNPTFRSPFCYPFSPLQYSATTPGYVPQHTPQYSPESPTYRPSTPEYIPCSPEYDPGSSPVYQPSSPTYNPSGRGALYSPSRPGIDFSIGFDDEYDPDKDTGETGEEYDPANPAM